MAHCFPFQCKIEIIANWFLAEILKCQNVFMDEINLEKKNNANNFALLENVVMMIICIEKKYYLEYYFD